NVFNGSSWTGWSEVPGGGVTFSAPVAVFNGSVNLFVRGTDDRIYLNAFSGVSWTGWSEVPGGGLTSSAPGGTATANRGMVLVVLGPDAHLFSNFLFQGFWRGWSEVPGGGVTFSSPAAYMFNGTLHLFARGTDDRIYDNLFDGVSSTGWLEVP